MRRKRNRESMACGEEDDVTKKKYIQRKRTEIRKLEADRIIMENTKIREKGWGK